MSFYLPGGWWVPFVDDDPTGQLAINFDGVGTGFSGILQYSTAVDFVRGGWDSGTGNFFLTRVRGGITRTYVGTVNPLLPWPQTGPYTLFGNYFDGSGTGGFWMAQTYVVA